jgi:hypothetical protein
MKTLLSLVVLSLIALPAWAKHPPRLFNEPIKLDNAGRPLYNQWERQEFERSQREKQRLNRSRALSATPGETGPDLSPAVDTGRIPAGHKVIGTPDQTTTVNSGAQQQSIIGNPTPTDDHTIEPTKIAPTPTQPTTSSEPPPGTQTPPHTQDYGF